MNRITLLITIEDTGTQTPPLDPPTFDTVATEIRSNLESVWPDARITLTEIDAPGTASHTYHRNYLHLEDRFLLGSRQERGRV